MQSVTNQGKQQPPSRGLKQVKVDNWGTFFLQRLQQLYFEEELLDLTIKFPTSDITVQAHRLVITTCTDYFTQLERQQKEKDENFDGVLIMPPDMPYECVKSIISFMYTGQLEYWTSEQNALYRTAQKMNMTVLTKLLDAQFNTSPLQSASPTSITRTPTPTNMRSNTPIILTQKPRGTQSSPAKKSHATASLPAQPLPGRKLPIWKRKLDSYPSSNYDGGSYHGSSSIRNTETTPGPSRFDLPEVDDFALGVFSSFDDITYNTKPIVQAADHGAAGSKQSSSGTNSQSYKRAIDTVTASGAELSSTISRNVDTTEDEDDDDMHQHQIQNVDSNSQSRGSDDKWENSEDEWTGPKPILRSHEVQPSPAKRVRFELEEKENLEKSRDISSTEDALNNHAKIIREVLKKYPHLVKNNKNIRLKIMQKEPKSSEPSGPAKTKVSYVVLKSDHLMSTSGSAGSVGTNDGNSSFDADEARKNRGNIGGNGVDGGETGPWKCNKCDLDEEYTNYYMYRRHMQDVHEEKFDPRVCEHCGYKAAKRNILMYHLYTKHNVPPPRSMCFPKCHACTYVALSETLLVRHQINHNHRPQMRSTSSIAEQVQCLTCSQTFKDVNELASHEINTGHGNSIDNKEKGNRCPHCGKVFVRITNLQVHLDCAHKEIRQAKLRENAAAAAVAAAAAGAAEEEAITEHESAQISLEPSSEAEALSHVASGIAASLGVGCDTIVNDHQDLIVTEENSFPICNATDIHLNNIVQDSSYNDHELVEGQQMIMLIDGETYQTHQLQQHNHREQGQEIHQGIIEELGNGHHQQIPGAHQLEISGNEQIVMQGTEEGMIVYIHGGNEAGHGNDRQTYETYQTVEIGGHEESEEIVEEVEEVVEEVEEEVAMVEETEHVNEGDEGSTNANILVVNDQGIIENSNGEQHIEGVIQYVEEETEIVEYDDSNSRQSNENDEIKIQQQQETMMVIEEEEEEIEEETAVEEHVESEDIVEQLQTKTTVESSEGRDLADEWDEDSADMVES